jgi:predicted GNAT superfamily acetyltransferase
MIDYRELYSNEDFAQCILLQKDVFNISDIDLISPLFLKLIARNNPPIGISIGAFNLTDKKLVGVIIGFATFNNNSVYGVLQGVNPEFRNKEIGLNLLLKLREVALEKGLESMQGIVDPLEANLAKLFFTNLGFNGIKYEPQVYKYTGSDSYNSIPIDKVLINWNFNSQTTIEKIIYRKRLGDETLFDETPIATESIKPISKNILIEIPNNFNDLKNKDWEQANKWRYSTREIFTYYLNQMNYNIVDFIKKQENQTYKSYYLLEKQ